MSTGWCLLRRIALIAVVLGQLVAERTELQAQKPADPADLQRVDFTLVDIGYQILVPKGSLVRLPNEQIQSIEIRRPLSRRIRLFEIGPPAANQVKYASSMTLSSGAVLKYNIDNDIGGGSGGPEGELKGQLQIGTRALSVMCHDQSAGFGSPPDPDWCIPYLHHLRVYDNK